MAKRLILVKKPTVGVTCNKCKYAHCVDPKRGKYYCVPPNGGRSWLCYGEHTCEIGEPR